DDVTSGSGEARHQPAEQRGGGRGADQLCQHEPGDIRWPDPRDGVARAWAMVTAGLANDVEAVNQYAAVILGTDGERHRRRPQPRAAKRSPRTSLNIGAGPWRTCREAKNSGSSNITFAAATPAKAPRIWTARGLARRPMADHPTSASAPAALSRRP